MKSPHTGIKRIVVAFRYSFQGIAATFKSEAAFRQNLVFFLVFSVTALWLPVMGIEKALMISSVFLILLMELVNTAIEAVIDRISPDYHDLSKKAKDIGSALVMMAYVHVALVWGVILWPYVFFKHVPSP